MRNAKPLLVAVRHLARRRVLGVFDMIRHQPHRRLLVLRHPEARQDRRRLDRPAPRTSSRSSIPSRTACSASTSSPGSSCPRPTTRRTSRRTCKLTDPAIPIARQPAALRRAGPALLPGRRSTRCSTTRPDSNPRFQINAQNCVHCKTCDIKDPVAEHQLDHARGRRRTELSRTCERRARTRGQQSRKAN